ncbi:hypothetical protein [Acidithiobacillus sp. AMEEHan]|uniref:hypothetical protein n=1 Tax=Acidithiobacillus sp. AMEEHan TaxID=2994951 RepID=UPI0027E4D2FB|nr:hypothetical protein [Acidithiobacillus sp. AMEEHan]
MMRSFARLLLAFAACAWVLPGRANELAGVWEGTVGTLPVRACFEEVKNDSAVQTYGQYYYLRYLRWINLVPPEGKNVRSGTFDEYDTQDQRWHLGPVEGQELGGIWTDGKKTLPIRLTRVNTHKKACTDPAYTGPMQKLRRKFAGFLSPMHLMSRSGPPSLP